MKQNLIESIMLKEAVSEDDKARILVAIDKWNDGDAYAVIPKYEDTPVPWDADISYDSSTGIITFEGGIDAGGPGYGRASMEVPIDRFLDYFEIEV